MKKSTHSLRRIDVVSLLLFAVFLAYGFRSLADYGVPIDEYSQIDLGRVNYERITTGSREIQTHYDRYYGPALEVPLFVFSRYIMPRFGMDEMDARHLGIFLFFSSSLVVFYRLNSRLTGHPAYGLLGSALLGLYPRFFAESFYNTKDLGFVAVTILVLSAAANAFRRHSWGSLLVLAVATGFSIAVRAQGLLLLTVLACVLFAENAPSARRRALTYIMASFVAAVMLFPVFWDDLVRNAVGFWQRSSYPVGVPTYFFGKSYISPDTPWQYHFVWVALTGMLSVLVTALAGIAWFVVRLFDRRNIDERAKTHLVMLGIVTGTFAVSVWFRPRSYDGWRHIYYMYPCLIGFSLYFLRRLSMRMQSMVPRALFVAAVLFMGVDIIATVGFIRRNHPNQYVYFNALAGGFPRAKANFDFDYWGISQKQLLEHLLNAPLPPSARIYVEQVLPYTETVMIPALQRKGYSITGSPEDADVYISIQRDIKEPPPPAFSRAYSVSVEGADLSAVYIRDTDEEN